MNYEFIIMRSLIPNSIQWCRMMWLLFIVCLQKWMIDLTDIRSNWVDKIHEPVDEVLVLCSVFSQGLNTGWLAIELIKVVLLLGSLSLWDLRWQTEVGNWNKSLNDLIVIVNEISDGFVATEFDMVKRETESLLLFNRPGPSAFSDEDLVGQFSEEAFLELVECFWVSEDLSLEFIKSLLVQSLSRNVQVLSYLISTYFWFRKFVRRVSTWGW